MYIFFTFFRDFLFFFFRLVDLWIPVFLIISQLKVFKIKTEDLASKPRFVSWVFKVVRVLFVCLFLEFLVLSFLSDCSVFLNVYHQ